MPSSCPLTMLADQPLSQLSRSRCSRRLAITMQQHRIVCTILTQKSAGGGPRCSASPAARTTRRLLESGRKLCMSPFQACHRAGLMSEDDTSCWHPPRAARLKDQ
eukprot:scaffold243150_cov31-Tisochrysis_lutea.AAC.2